MNPRTVGAILIGGAAAYFLMGQKGDTAKPTAPVKLPCPLCPPTPKVPDTRPLLPKRPGPWGTEAGVSVETQGTAEGRLAVQAKVGGQVAPDGRTEIQIDLPGDLHRANIESKGQGCCVFTSIHHSALWQNIPELQEFPKWLQKKGLTGGGYPGNVKERITAICKERGVLEPAYLQIENSKDIEILRLACKTGRFPAVTYSKSPTGRYGGGTIAHMVSLPHADQQYLAVLDNNYIGIDKYEWMSADEFIKVANPRGYWAVILLGPGPPIPPRNRP